MISGRNQFFIKHLVGLIEKELITEIDEGLKISSKEKETYDRLKQVLFTIL